MEYSQKIEAFVASSEAVFRNSHCRRSDSSSPTSSLSKNNEALRQVQSEIFDAENLLRQNANIICIRTRLLFFGACLGILM